MAVIGMSASSILVITNSLRLLKKVMSIIYVLIPVAIILDHCWHLLRSFWAVKTEQFNDLEKEGMSILFDDKKSESEPNGTDKQDDSAVEQTKIETDSNDKSSQ